MENNLLWTPQQEAGLEHLHLRQNDEGIHVDSVVIGIHQNIPFRAWYEIHVDRDWKVQHCTLRILGDSHQQITLQADSENHWTDAAATALPALDGCIDVDISITPFTNTLPIRRLSLNPGQSVDIVVAYIAVPELEVRPVPQRYTCLESSAAGGLYRYESLTSGFTRDLRVDAQGLVIDYPGIWKRIFY
jgi:hypothetical protein